MGPRDFSIVFAGAATVELGLAARYVHVMRAPTAAVFIKIDDGDELERVTGEGIFVGSGFKNLKIRSAVAQNVRVMVADEPQVTGGGTGASGAAPTIVSELPSSAIATPAADVIATASALAIAANTARRRLSISALSTNTGSVFVQANAAGAGRGIELQPGMTVELKTTAAVDVRNDSGANQTVMRFEET